MVRIPDNVPAGNKAKQFLTVNHTTKPIHHHHYHHGVKGVQTVEAPTNRCYSQGKISCAMKGVISKNSA